MTVTSHDLLTRTPPTDAMLQHAHRLCRQGYLRSEIVRLTGLTADDVSKIKQRVQTETAQGRCSKTEDLFG